MTKREIRKECYIDMLEDSIVAVESVINQLHKLKNREGIIADDVLQRDTLRTYCDLELALASTCIILRKMVENLFINVKEDIRRDMNSIIHSNKLEYYNMDLLFVYSQKGQEEVSVNRLLSFAKSITTQ